MRRQDRISLKQLEVLCAVAKTGSISRATKVLGISQPTVSQQIAKLEDVLGTPLLFRGCGNNGLTSAGDYWFKVGDRVQKSLKLAEDEFAAYHQNSTLAIKLGVLRSFAGKSLAKITNFATSIEEISNIRVDLATNSDELAEMIESHTIDVAIMETKWADKLTQSFNITPLYDDELIWVVPFHIPQDIVFKILKGNQDLQNNDTCFLRYAEYFPDKLGKTCPFGDYSTRWYRHHLPGSSPYYSCESPELAIDFVAEGLGTCHIPKSFLRNMANRLKHVKLYTFNANVESFSLVMQKHLLSLSPYKNFKKKIVSFLNSENENFFDEVSRIIGTKFFVTDTDHRLNLKVV